MHTSSKIDSQRLIPPKRNHFPALTWLYEAYEKKNFQKCNFDNFFKTWKSFSGLICFIKNVLLQHIKNEDQELYRYVFPN